MLYPGLLQASCAASCGLMLAARTDAAPLVLHARFCLHVKVAPTLLHIFSGSDSTQLQFHSMADNTFAVSCIQMGGTTAFQKAFQVGSALRHAGRNHFMHRKMSYLKVQRSPPNGQVRGAWSAIIKALPQPLDPATWHSGLRDLYWTLTKSLATGGTSFEVTTMHVVKTACKG